MGVARSWARVIQQHGPTPDLLSASPPIIDPVSTRVLHGCSRALHSLDRWFVTDGRSLALFVTDEVTNHPRKSRAVDEARATTPTTLIKWRPLRDRVSMIGSTTTPADRATGQLTTTCRRAGMGPKADDRHGMQADTPATCNTHRRGEMTTPRPAARLLTALITGVAATIITAGVALAHPEAEGSHPSGCIVTAEPGTVAPGGQFTVAGNFGGASIWVLPGAERVPWRDGTAGRDDARGRQLVQRDLRRHGWSGRSDRRRHDPRDRVRRRRPRDRGRIDPEHGDGCADEHRHPRGCRSPHGRRRRRNPPAGNQGRLGAPVPAQHEAGRDARPLPCAPALSAPG